MSDLVRTEYLILASIIDVDDWCFLTRNRFGGHEVVKVSVKILPDSPLLPVQSGRKTTLAIVSQGAFTVPIIAECSPDHVRLFYPPLAGRAVSEPSPT